MFLYRPRSLLKNAGPKTSGSTEPPDCPRCVGRAKQLPLMYCVSPLRFSPGLQVSTGRTRIDGVPKTVFEEIAWPLASVAPLKLVLKEPPVFAVILTPLC